MMEIIQEIKKLDSLKRIEDDIIDTKIIFQQTLIEISFRRLSLPVPLTMIANTRIKLLIEMKKLYLKIVLT